MPSTKTKKIDEELVCAESILHTLKKMFAVQQINIVREENDPPDFWLTVEDRKFAVEVTSIVKDEQYLARSRDFEDAVRQKARLNKEINGTYIIYIQEPTTIPKKNSKEWNKLLEKAVSLIHEKRDDGAKYSLYNDGRKSLTIQKTDPNGSNVGVLISTGVKSEGEVQQELSILMQASIEKKRENLIKQGVASECTDIIIAFYDAYGYGDIQDAQKALQEVRGFEWFHSVFWAASFSDRTNELWVTNPGRKGCFLHSREKSWMKTKQANQPDRALPLF